MPAWLCLEQFRAAADLLAEKRGINHSAGSGLSVAVNKGPALGREEGGGEGCASAITADIGHWEGVSGCFLSMLLS